MARTTLISLTQPLYLNTTAINYKAGRASLKKKHNLLKKIDVRERKKGRREREKHAVTETHCSIATHKCPKWGLNQQPGYVP